MQMIFKHVICVTALTGMAVYAQTSANHTQVSGTITAVDAAASKIALKSDKGDDVAVSTTARTLFLKIPPGETDARKGTKIALTDIAAGDRAVVVAPQGSDPKTLAASAVLVMSKTHVPSLHQKHLHHC